MSKKSGSSKRNKSRKIVASLAEKLPQEPRVRLSGAKPPAPRNAAKPVRDVPAAAKSGSEAEGPETSNVAASSTSAAPQELKRRELIDRVVAKSDVKKKYAKPVIEAMLEVLGDTLSEGREMNLQPLGKVKLNRTKETPTARVIVAKIRQNKSAAGKAAGDQDALADAAE